MDHILYYLSGLSLAHSFPTNFLEIAVYRTEPLRRDQQDFQELKRTIFTCSKTEQRIG